MTVIPCAMATEKLPLRRKAPIGRCGGDGVLASLRRLVGEEKETSSGRSNRSWQDWDGEQQELCVGGQTAVLVCVLESLNSIYSIQDINLPKDLSLS